MDIGDKVKKGDVLATLFVPELVEELGTKKATVELDQERIALAKKVVEVAAADVKAAEARLEEAKAILDKYQAEVDRWDTEVKRLKREVDRGVVDPQMLLESTNQLKVEHRGTGPAKATIKRAEAELLSEQATLAKAKVDVRVAEADLTVAESEEQADRGLGRLPHAHRAVRRRDHGPQRQHFRLRPARHRRPHRLLSLAPPLARRRRRADLRGRPPRHRPDLRRHPRAGRQLRQDRDEGDRARPGVTATSRSPATVTRTSWALNMKSRTLRAEIDLPNPDSQLLPGMYAYAKVIIERPNVRALPLDALAYSGEQTFCWLYEGGKAVRTEVETGHQRRANGSRSPIAGPRSRRRPQDSVRLDANRRHGTGDSGRFVGLTEGRRVNVAPATMGTKEASATPALDRGDR